MVPNPEAFKLIKDGYVWDYSTHLEDIENWRSKIMREDPNAMLEVLPATKIEMYEWKGT